VIFWHRTNDIGGMIELFYVMPS